MCSALFKGHFDSPPLDEAAHYFYWGLALVSTEVSSRLKLLIGIMCEHPPDGQHRQANPVPHSCAAHHLHVLLCSVIPSNLHLQPLGFRVVQHCVQLGQLLSFHSWASIRTRLTRRRGSEQTSI